MAEEDRLWTVQEVAGYLNVHPQSVYAMKDRGELPCIYIGSRIRFSRNDVLEWVAVRRDG